jgi:effector-binding domain-containing protein
VAMAYTIEEHEVGAQWIAAVRACVPAGGVAAAFRQPLDRVWAFLRAHPGLRTDGHNLFLYQHGAGSVPTVDFGVQVTRSFDGDGDVQCVATPAGRVASTVHRGSYARLGDAHAALAAWCERSGRAVGAASWEIYGDWSDDPARLETTVVYQVA